MFARLMLHKPFKASDHLRTRFLNDVRILSGSTGLTISQTTEPAVLQDHSWQGRRN